MIARPFSFPCEIASPIAPRTPDDSIEEKPAEGFVNGIDKMPMGTED